MGADIVGSARAVTVDELPKEHDYDKGMQTGGLRGAVSSEQICRSFYSGSTPAGWRCIFLFSYM